MSPPRRGWLVVFAKAPRPGAVKTRLCPPLSPEQAADLYGCLLDDAVAESLRAVAGGDLELVLAVDPPGAPRELARRGGRGVRAIAQQGPDLGARMIHVARQAAAAGAACAILRGSDSPLLTAALVREARTALAAADLVIAPDADGGYGLVGLGPGALRRGLDPGGLFAHPMSTPTALADTLAGAARLGLSVARLPAGFDVDRVEDLVRLAAVRHELVSNPCPRTLAFLDAHALWPAPLPGASPRRAG